MIGGVDAAIQYLNIRDIPLYVQYVVDKVSTYYTFIRFCISVFKCTISLKLYMYSHVFAVDPRLSGQLWAQRISMYLDN